MVKIHREDAIFLFRGNYNHERSREKRAQRYKNMSSRFLCSAGKCAIAKAVRGRGYSCDE